VVKMIELGNKMRWGENLIAAHPSLARVPQLASGGAIPIPIKLNVDSAKMAAGIRNVTVTINNPKVLGKRWRRRIQV
jgi:hypothetical protein